jgi:GNAT superfamily N-acetyltransferase
MPDPTVRDARPGDAEVIARFNAALADETEGKRLDPAVLRAGVLRALADPDRLRYWVAESDGRVVGQAAVTREWSDWRNGWIWWFQSVFVAPEHRARGVFRALHGAIRAAALAEPDVIGLRLYVEEANAKAQATYQALGMRPGGYHVFEEIWPDRFGRAEADAPER